MSKNLPFFTPCHPVILWESGSIISNFTLGQTGPIFLWPSPRFLSLFILYSISFPPSSFSLSLSYCTNFYTLLTLITSSSVFIWRKKSGKSSSGKKLYMKKRFLFVIFSNVLGSPRVWFNTYEVIPNFLFSFDPLLVSLCIFQ